MHINSGILHGKKMLKIYIYMQQSMLIAKLQHPHKTCFLHAVYSLLQTRGQILQETVLETFGSCTKGILTDLIRSMFPSSVKQEA